MQLAKVLDKSGVGLLVDFGNGALVFGGAGFFMLKVPLSVELQEGKELFNGDQTCNYSSFAGLGSTEA